MARKKKTDSKQPKGPETKTDVFAKVADWLNTQGYPLEYRTYWSFFGKFGGSCGLGSYIETTDGTAREIDVYAYQTHLELEKGIGFHLRVICECKYSRDKPWILLYGNLDKSWIVTDWMHTPRSRRLYEMPNLSDARVKGLLQKLEKSFHFSQGVHLAHNLVQAFSKPGEQDSAYNSLRKITHAAWDFLRISEETLKTRIYEMVFPCLVVNGPLMGAWFDPTTGLIKAQEVKYGRVCWQGCRNGTNVDVVHESALEEYAKKVDHSFLIDIMPVLVALYDV